MPVVRISNFGDCRFDGREVVHSSSEISSAYKRTILRGGELVVSIRGTVGRVAIVPASASEWNISREVAVIPLLPGVNRALVHRALLGDSLQRFMLGNVKGVAQSGINLKDLRLAPIPAPSPNAIKKFESFVTTTEALERKVNVAVLKSHQLIDALVGPKHEVWLRLVRSVDGASRIRAFGPTSTALLWVSDWMGLPRMHPGKLQCARDAS